MTLIQWIHEIVIMRIGFMSKMLGMVYYIGIYNLHDMLSDAKKLD